MYIVGNKFTSDLDSTEVYSEQEFECKNVNCSGKGNKEKSKTKVNWLQNKAESGIIWAKEQDSENYDVATLIAGLKRAWAASY